MDGEAGLLGMAFHPDFATNGRVYLNFSELVGGQIRSVTAEFTSMDGGQTLDPASERDLLTVVKPAANHNGGNLAFGPDGFLYLGLGDGGGAGDPNGNAQNPRALLGKMLRIDVDSRPGGAPYGIPGGANGNPFVRKPALQRRTAPAPRTARRSTRSASAIPGAGASTASRASCGSATSARTASRKSTSSSATATTAGIRARARTASSPRAAARPRGSRIRSRSTATASASRSPAATSTAARKRREIAGRYVFGDFGGMIASLAPNGSGGFNVEQLVEQGCTPPEAQGALQISCVCAKTWTVSCS